MSSSDVESSDTGESDVELQEAFAAGLLKPGLNEVVTKKIYVNDVNGLVKKRKEIVLNLPFVETLVCTNEPAVLAPDLQLKEQELTDKRQNEMKNNKKLPQFTPSDDPVLNDFKRETLFYRQAQASVLEAIPKLKELGLPTRRPDDYYAEMAKSDAQMQKIRQKMLQLEHQKKNSERVKQLRVQRKEGKALQVQAKLDRLKEKKEVLEQVKKVRKGLSNDLSFNKKSVEKRKQKDKKYGFGGKKRGMNRNTRESAADISEYEQTSSKRRFGGAKGKMGAKVKAGGKGKPGAKRPGKNRRVQIKNRKGKK